MFSEGSLHHAYVCFGHVAHDVAEAFCAAAGIARQGNPDVFEEQFDTFSIDDARTLHTRAHKKALGTHMVFVLSARAIGAEAQQALLKLLEEPPAHTHIIFVVPVTASIVPTLASRVMTIRAAQKERIDISSFVTQSPEERLAYVATLVKDTPELIDSFLNAAEVHFAQDIARNALAITHLFDVRTALAMRGTSKKQLLESIALTI